MDEICIESVTITPNPVFTGETYKIEVQLYSLYPMAALYPSTDLFPGADLLGTFPAADLYPGNDLNPAEGGMSE